MHTQVTVVLGGGACSLVMPQCIFSGGPLLCINTTWCTDSQEYRL